MAVVTAGAETLVSVCRAARYCADSMFEISPAGIVWLAGRTTTRRAGRRPVAREQMLRLKGDLQ